jgi:hypothetical protein
MASWRRIQKWGPRLRREPLRVGVFIALLARFKTAFLDATEADVPLHFSGPCS